MKNFYNNRLPTTMKSIKTLLVFPQIVAHIQKTANRLAEDRSINNVLISSIIVSVVVNIIHVVGIGIYV